MRIWVDDIRTPPDDDGFWWWCKNSSEAIRLLVNAKFATDRGWVGSDDAISVMSLDHDLGGDDTSRRIVLWMCENEFWPEEVRVHSANPVGVEWLEGMIERYKP